jgi:hypothetical protein
MPLLHSYLCRARGVLRVRGWLVAESPARQVGRALAIGSCLSVAPSCSFDSSPQSQLDGGLVSVQDDDAAGPKAPDDAAGLTERDGTASTPAADGSKRNLQDGGAARPGRSPGGAMTMTMTMTAPASTRDAGAARDAGEPPEQAPEPGNTAQDAGAPSGENEAEAEEPRTTNPNCMEGVYEGTLTGSLQTFGLSLGMVSAHVRTQLMMNPAGTYLEMRNARVESVDANGNTLTATLFGNISCADHGFHDGEMTDGVFHNAAANSDTMFRGTVDGQYSADVHSLAGSWTIQTRELFASLSGRGEWSLLLQQ